LAEKIRVLLIDSFVMTTLFYPALALQFRQSSSKNNRRRSDTLLGSAKDDPFSLLTTPWLDNFFPYSQPGIQLSTPIFFWEQSRNSSDEGLARWVYEEIPDSYGEQEGNAQLVAAPIAWITVEQVLASNRPDSIVTTGDSRQPEEPENRLFANEQMAEHVQQVMDIMRSTEGILSADCLEVSLRQSGCLADWNPAQSNAVVYLRVVPRDSPFMKSKLVESVWRNANEAIASRNHGILLDPTMSGGSEGASRFIAVHVRRYICYRDRSRS
jgi:hypothetical protein